MQTDARVLESKIVRSLGGEGIMTEISSASEPDKCQAGHHYERTVDQDIELWKHHASIGGQDKDRMVTIVSWLLGFSAVTLWYIITRLIDSEAIVLEKPRIAMLVAVLGVGVSILALYISLLYGGYSNQNWEKADKIACDRKWYDLLPPNGSYPRHDDIHKGGAEPVPEPQGLGSRQDGKPHLLNCLPRSWAKPSDPKKMLAPVFITFFCLATLSLVLHLVIFVCAVITIL
jgi:hypothetical protein